MKKGLDLDVAPLNESISQTPSALLVPYSGDGFSSAFFFCSSLTQKCFLAEPQNLPLIYPPYNPAWRNS